MAQTLLRDKTRILRNRGASLNDIVKQLKAPKSTIRYWCRDIVLSDAQLKRLFKKQRLGGMKAAEKLRKKRIFLTQQLLRDGIKEAGKITKRDLFIAGIALYWAEGYRKGDGEFGFTNSDPKMIKFIIKWLQQVFKTQKKKIHLRVYVNIDHKNRISDIQDFWSKTVKIPLQQFSKPTFIKIKNKKRHLNSSEYFGVIRVKVRNSVNLKRKLLGFIEGLTRF